MNRASLSWQIALAVLAAACTQSSSEDVAASESDLTVPVAPNVARQYVQYNSNFAYQIVILHPDATYHVILGQKVFTGHWAFDLPTSKVTMTPGEGSEPPPELEYPVKREDCTPDGWFPVLMRGERKMIPYGIDPEFEKQYCQLWSPTP